MMFKYIAEATMKPRTKFQFIITRSAIINWRRKSWRKLPSSNFAKFPKYYKLFRKYGIEPPAVKKLFTMNQCIFERPLNELEEVFARCDKRQVDMSTLSTNARLLVMPIDIMEQRIMLLEEMGVEHIHAALISSYYIVGSMRMSLFKAIVEIPESVDMVRKMIECLEPLPPDVPPPEPLREDLSVSYFRERCWEWYLNWRFNLSEAHKALLDEVIPAMRSRSFRVMKRQIDILHDDVGLTAEQILRGPYLGRGCPDELENTIKTMETFGGIDIKKLIRVRPILYTVACDNAMNVERVLDEHGFTDAMKRRCPEVLLLPYMEVKKRIDIINSTPELRVLKNNKRSLMLVKSMSIVQIRLNYLRHHNVNFATVRALTARPRVFKSLLQTGMDKTTGREIATSFSKIFNLEEAEIERRVRKHPFWRSVAIASMHDVVEFLLERFSPEDIRDNILLILYPKERVAETLKNLPEMNELSGEKQLTGKSILAICLYEIEREYHFSGDGIWRQELSPPLRRRFREQIEAEQSDDEDSEDIEPAPKARGRPRAINE